METSVTEYGVEAEERCDFKDPFQQPYVSSFGVSYGPRCLQPLQQTRKNRFPKIFTSAKELQPNARRILSFGCATGEECDALAELFPEAEIVGVEINHWAVQTARRNNKYPGRLFFHDEIGATGKYDLALCLMVLFCMEYPVKFDLFEATLREIDAHLNPGALLMIYTAEFNPLQVEEVARGYTVLRDWTHVHNRNQKEYFDGYYRKK